MLQLFDQQPVLLLEDIDFQIMLLLQSQNTLFEYVFLFLRSVALCFLPGVDEDEEV